MNTDQRQFDEGKMRFIRENGSHPTRVIMPWTMWRDLIELHLRYSHCCDVMSEYLKEGPTFEGMRVLRTYDCDAMKFLK